MLFLKKKQNLGAVMRIKLNKAEGIIEDWLKPLSKGQFEPLIKVWSGPKITRRHFFSGIKSKRNHHFLSDGEKRLGLVREALPQTVNYFEQYPLWDIGLCIEIAIDMGIKYPVDKDGEAYVLSTDLLCLELDFETKQVNQVARTYKPIASFLTESNHPVSVTRTLQKLELERRYYKEKTIPFHIETDVNISKAYANNLVWARKSTEYIGEFIQHQEKFIYAFVNAVYGRPDDCIVESLERVCTKIGITFSDAMALFQWGIWSHQIPADLEKTIHVLEPLILKEVA